MDGEDEGLHFVSERTGARDARSDGAPCRIYTSGDNQAMLERDNIGRLCPRLCAWRIWMSVIDW